MGLTQSTLQIAVASKGGLLRILDPKVSPLAPESEQVLFTQEIPKLSPTDETNIVAFGYDNGILYACTSSGTTQFLQLPEDDATAVVAETYTFAPAEGTVAAFAIHPTEYLPGNPGIPKAVAIGGENRELEIWESELVDGKVRWKSVWKAKNVKPTKLGLEVPVWVQCIIFLPSVSSPAPPASGRGRRNTPGQGLAGTYRIATGTHYSHLRLYDTSVSRRPVFTATLSQTPILQLRLHPSTLSSPELPLTSGKESPESTNTLQELHFIHTDMNGHFGLYSTSTRRSLGVYKGSTGAVLSVASIISKEGGEPLIAGVGFDRYLWVYEGEEREVVSKVYAKTKGTAVVVLDTEDEKLPEKKNKKQDGEVEEDGVWDEMEEVEDEDEDKEDEGDFTAALVKIKRKKGGSKNGKKKKRRVE